MVGPPNAGKSSLVNALARRDVAIVAETAGTTRDHDIIEPSRSGAPCGVTAVDSKRWLCWCPDVLGSSRLLSIRAHAQRRSP